VQHNEKRSISRKDIRDRERRAKKGSVNKKLKENWRRELGSKRKKKNSLKKRTNLFQSKKKLWTKIKSYCMGKKAGQEEEDGYRFKRGKWLPKKQTKPHTPFPEEKRKEDL